ncbi:MAG TPA: transglycosylase SLT domain-containing protein [Bdellovibrionota bacterium]|jgi:membrane-bound lytic murein transglycosylase F|nr:transglycosylase SLT domain-containing protein [Bdellovibrionota bacterium]
MDAPLKRILGLILCALGLVVVAKGFNRDWLKPQSNQSRTLTIAVREADEERGSLYEEHGFDRDLFETFALEAGYETQFIATASTQEALELVKNGEADAALGVYESPLDTTFQKSPSYTQIQPLIACRAGVNFKKLAAEGKVSILIPEDYNLQNAEKTVKTLYPEALFLRQKDLNVGDAISIMHDKQIDCTLTQERLFKIYKLAYPRMSSSLLVGGALPIAIHFAGQAWSLKNEFDLWFNTKTAKVQIDSIKEKYFGFYEIFDAYEVEVFEKRIESRLRAFIPYFKEAERKYGIAWEILAAIAYQESHWDPKAKSFTGVRGIMMLTKATAKEMGVSDRVDPRKSILGGAAYLQKIMKRLPEEIPADERLFFALASYNVGYGHVRDAQSLVSDSNAALSWHAVKKSLPLLSKRHVYTKLRHGKARGREPVLYVQRIRKFHKLLSLAFSSDTELRSSNVWADNTSITTKNPLVN